MYNNEEESYKKKFETIEEKKDYVKYYFWHIGDKNFIRSLKRFKDKRGFGIECVGILFHEDFQEWEKYRCKEDEVALIMDYPAAEEDTIGYLGFHQFYSYVCLYGQEFIQKYPEKNEEVSRLLEEMKESWGI